MKSATTGTVSGCVAWMLVFCVLSICVLSVGPLVGILIPEFNKDFVANTLGPYLCPPESTAFSYTEGCRFLSAYVAEEKHHYLRNSPSSGLWTLWATGALALPVVHKSTAHGWGTVLR